jgi:uncharacterized alkaline shock family protein YloU
MSGTPVPDAAGDSAGHAGTVGSGGTSNAADLPRAAAYENQRKHVRIETRVLEKTGVRAALSVPGVIVHSSGIGKLTGRRLPRIAVRMDSQGRSATVDAQIAVAWPGPVVAVAQVARETVAEWIEHSTGVPVIAVNVEVAAVVPTDDPASGRVTIQDLREAPRTPLLTPVTATPLAVTPVTAPAARAADRLRHPVAPEHSEVVHPRAARPPAPVSVTVPPPLPVQHVQPPVPAPVAHVAPPVTPSVVHVQPPVAPAVVHVGPPPPPEIDGVQVVGHPQVTRPVTPPPVPLAPVEVWRTPVTAPPPPVAPVLTPVPAPPPPPLRNIPTPRGLPVENIPTPQGLPLTVFPQVRRRGLRPVTVRRHPRIPVTVRKEQDS